MVATLLRYPTDTLDIPSSAPDRTLVEAILAFSSSEPEREQAAAWLAAYETACAFGVGDDEALARADDAWQRATARLRRLAA
jgi:hypothetical protein